MGSDRQGEVGASEIIIAVKKEDNEVNFDVIYYKIHAFYNLKAALILASDNKVFC